MKVGIVAILSVMILLFISSCKMDKSVGNQENDNSYFEGEIEFIESRRIIGNLTDLRITYTLSEDRLKREVRYVNSITHLEYAGLIIDLENDSITLYYGKNKNQGVKYGLSLNEFQEMPKNELPRRDLSPFDDTFLQLSDYNKTFQVEDSAEIHNYLSDYTHYQDNRGFFEQGIFDTKEIKVKRLLLETVFTNLQKGINFPLNTSSGILKIIGMEIGTQDTSKKSGDPDHSWFDKGIEKLKSGVGHVIEMNTSCKKILSRSTESVDFQLPGIHFKELKSLEEFYESYDIEEKEDVETESSDTKSKLKELKKLKKLKELDWDD